MSSSNTTMVKKLTFAQMKSLCAAYAGHLQKHHQDIAKVMTAYQSHAVTAVKIERSVECLTSLDEIKQYLTKRTKRVCTFFPLNLPVYSLVLFAMIPSLTADEVFLRPPQTMIPVFNQLLASLSLPKSFPNIHVAFSDRETFVRECVADADVTIFTGKKTNARHVLQTTKKDSLFLFNGWGCNPIVVAADANIELAAERAAEAKLFNSGQDCAGPDNILVHRDVADQFLTHLKQIVDDAKVGDYSDPDVLVGRIAEESALVRLASFLLKHRAETIYGGVIDFPKAIVHPTMIVAPLSQQTNYEEFFSPIFYINIYDDDSQLAKYFDDPRYKANDMYVSLFGTSAYVSTLKRSIVHKEQTILDVERGNSAYGGYSFGASFVATNGKIEARPILVPKEMFQFLEAKAFKSAVSAPRKIAAAEQKRICQDIATTVEREFSDNLVFGFVFGSVAKGLATSNSDIDTMVVVKVDKPAQRQSYLAFMESYHKKHDLSYDPVYPVELITLDELNQSLATLDSITMDLDHISKDDWDASFWTAVFCGMKRGIVGNEKFMYQLARSVGKYPEIWKQQMIDQLEHRVENLDNDEVAAAMNAIRKMSFDDVQKLFTKQNYESDQHRMKDFQEKFGSAAEALLGGES
ncbi:Uu.00g034100.m01.CDS01 [Anthostomella pinea]|uniref:Uu.00g034100.m01.CDS01 n=1 Tax=Anthostomella pinea TaxID=933095 RepID=A0AAI8V9H3_9PEZI|nr:Uu.00g034100.m01.CDS01 [Anthostomella pinea]